MSVFVREKEKRNKDRRKKISPHQKKKADTKEKKKTVRGDEDVKKIRREMTRIPGTPTRAPALDVCALAPRERRER